MKTEIQYSIPVFIYESRFSDHIIVHRKVNAHDRDFRNAPEKLSEPTGMDVQLILVSYEPFCFEGDTYGELTGIGCINGLLISLNVY